MNDNPAITALNQQLQEYYAAHARPLPWRQAAANGRLDPYHILVSEIMLQQTQVPRVIPKYHDFLTRFPSLPALAAAPLSQVIAAWSGLGYNRRAKYLHQAAKAIAEQHGGHVPDTLESLTALPGIGPNTAGAILAYAYNQPAVFIETNIRTVIIHHCFADEDNVADKAVAGTVAELLRRWNAQREFSVREFYWALMDYGSWLKLTAGNASRKSRHYAKQAAFQGSLRAVRGQVLRRLINGPLTKQQLQNVIGDDRLATVLASLSKEGLIVLRGRLYSLAD